MAQTRLAARLLKEATGIDVEIVQVTSQGDVNRVAPIHQIGRPGAFTHELEDAILDGRIDAAVHSLKDMPVQQPPEAPIAAVLPRGDVRDALIVHRDWHDPAQLGLPLKPGARVGTSAPRRQSQLVESAPEAIPVDVRGNVETRLRLVADGLLDALLMAEAPFSRVDLPLPENLLHVHLDPERAPGSPGQGAIAVQARADSEAYRAFRHLHHEPTAQAVTLERRILSHLGGGCGLPIGAWARAGSAGGFRVSATFETDGGLVRVHREGGDAETLAKDVARLLEERPTPAATPTHPNGPRRLEGRRVLVLLEAERAAPYLDALRAAGATAEAWSPTAHDSLVRTASDIAPATVDAWRRAAWALVASPRAVDALKLLNDAHPNPSARFGAVGPATAKALRAAGFPVHLVSPDGTGGGLGRLLAAKWPPKGPVLLPQAEESTADLAAALQAGGVETVPWIVYRTRALDPVPAPPLALPVDAVVVASPSAARALGNRQPLEVAAHWIAFGPTTAQALRAQGFPVAAVSPRRTPQALLDVIP